MVPPETENTIIDAASFVPSRIPSKAALHEPWKLTEEQRQRYRQLAIQARAAKAAGLDITSDENLHPINIPKLSTKLLMPQREDTGISALSLFSGGGGLDLGFSRIGINNVAAFEIMDDAADTIRVACPEMKVYGGEAGDVREVDWSPWRGSVDILHGGPPCQPFSHAGRQRGSLDPRDMWPEFVRAVLKIRPAVFVGENVPALGEAKFAEYVNQTILAPLSKGYHIHVVQLRAQDFGVPQIRRRIFFIGFRNKRIHGKYRPPTPTHAWNDNEALESGIVKCMGVREALGLRESGFDDLSPTIRSTLNGPRNTTSILNSVSARNRFEKLQIWPNGVAASREKAQKFPSPNGHFRLSVPDVALIQGFPDDWPFSGATYKVLGQIGNAVPPPLAYNVAASIVAALGRIK